MNVISVIVPVYNAEKYLDRCIKSILKAKRVIKEVILVDDGSTDNSSTICKKYAAKNNIIKYIYQKNGGPSKARNVGIKKASGDYIMFIDSDDYIELDTININKCLSNNSDFWIFPNIFLVNNNYKNKSIRSTLTGQFQLDNTNIIRELIKSEVINSPWSKLYKNRIIKEHNILFNERYNLAEDLLFNITYLKYCKSFFVSDQIYYCYYYNNESLTKKYIPNKYDTLMSVNNDLKPFLEDMKISDTYYFFKNKNIFSCIKSLHHSQCDLNYNEKINTIKMYKKNNDVKILYKYGVKIFMWSILLNVFPSKMIFFITK